MHGAAISILGFRRVRDYSSGVMESNSYLKAAGKE